jgi:hypothetical protein
MRLRLTDDEDRRGSIRCNENPELKNVASFASRSFAPFKPKCEACRLTNLQQCESHFIGMRSVLFNFKVIPDD